MHIDGVLTHLISFFEIFKHSNWTVQSLVWQIESILIISTWYNFFASYKYIRRVCAASPK
jgi:hypothetical protein